MRPNIGEDLVRLRMREIEERVGHPRVPRRRPRRLERRVLEEPRRPAERDPDARPRMDTLDDWILFGPRMH